MRESQGARRAAGRAGDPRAHAAVAGTLLLAAAAIYASGLEAPFHFDDSVNIVGNPFIRWTALDLGSLRGVTSGGANRRPVADLSFALSYYFSGYRAPAFRAVNIALHGICGLLVYALALRCRDRWEALRPAGARSSPGARTALAAFSALLFVAHPLQTQSVTYVVQRMNLLAAAFYLGALLLYAAGRERPPGRERVVPFTAAAGCGLLAFGSKELAITLPAALWLFEWFFHRDLDRGFARRSLLRVGLPLGVAAGALYYAYFQGPEWGYAKRDFTLAQRGLTQLRVVAFYLGLIALPLPGRQSVHHVFEPSHSLLDPPSTAAAGLLLALILAGAVAAAPRWRLPAFGALWFFLHHAIESSILPLEMAYEHRNYLPLVGPCLALPPAVAALGRRLRVGPRVLLAAGVLAVCALGTASAARNRVWLDGVSLWSDALARYPDASRAHNNLGVALAERGEYDRAEQHYREAIRVEPGNATAHRNLGISRLRRGDLDAAAAHLADARARKPRDATTEAALGDVARLRGALEEAAGHYQRSLGIYPDEQAFHGLGRVRERQGRAREALHYYELALRTQPGFGPARFGRATALAAEGRLAEADAALAGLLSELDGDARSAVAPALWSALAPGAAAAAAAGHGARAREIAGWAERVARELGRDALARRIAERRARYGSEGPGRAAAEGAGAGAR